MKTARIVFLLIAIPFTLLALFGVAMDQAWSAGRVSSGTMIFTLCGTIYIYGSILALEGDPSFSSLLLRGIFLNLVGACLWIPALDSSDAKSVGLIGAGLTFVWLIEIFKTHNDEQQ